MSQRRFRGVPVTTINGPTVPGRAPYDRLRAIIAAAHAGELQPEPRKDRDMKVLRTLDEPEVRLSEGAQIVQDLIDSGKSVLAFNATTSETRIFRKTASDHAKAAGFAVSIIRVKTATVPTARGHEHRFNLILTPIGDAA